MKDTKKNISTTADTTITRRKFLKAGIFAAAGISALGAADAFYIEPFGLQVTRLDVPIKGLPRAFDGFRIAQISDTHHSRLVGLDYIARAVETANALNPDLVALTGDYVTGGARYVVPGVELFSKLKAKHGIVAVLGNHDHWTDETATIEMLKKIGALHLKNAHTLLSRGGGKICIAGVADLWADTPVAADALRGVAPGVPRILLSHNPDYAEEMWPNLRVDFMMSGHTHGGQVHLPFVGAPFLPSGYGQKYRAGLVQAPRCRVYVSRGIGLIRPPVRFRCRPELPLFTLRVLKN